MSSSILEREKVIELARTMSAEKLASWYEYGLFIQSRTDNLEQDDLGQEFRQWEQASAEDFLNLEKKLEGLH